MGKQRTDSWAVTDVFWKQVAPLIPVKGAAKSAAKE